ncbi:hypothetical protein POPA111323_04285 [Polynucleobacter paneuropaeus]|jgi:hypothetical protein|uniref:Uncharacterized protein n=1 Tax=Polynucleobacter paneuropaeus TaxID=2527775 RepID=A0A2Z4JT63_9BURK|nr:hypothetical protein [Polynucleobacter paneuropaeus]AWW44316.1 hypothetical protein DPM16_03155 [Polynucleobacter paneuropaeus]AWW45936.1 hypothetical protein DPM18_03370 [Polynucleobacter paneuropaeus]AWW47769.1 hypothetical protein DPM17_03375 [Polynucleobacter paneuropaeus]AWW49956.1 hypothetical protein Pas1_05930 [Polynucleobacter paneuropaeus]MBT8514070.1 hypothetical protein [Polynucleobacter paneuropaeus]
MKPLNTKAKLVAGWTILMTVIGTAILHQWQFFALGCASLALILVANQYGLIKDNTDQTKK